MNYVMLSIIILVMNGISIAKETQWLTILVHGAFGFQANASIKTIIQAKKDFVEGTDYERNVLKMRPHQFFSMVQPMQKMGLIPVTASPHCLSAAYAFGELFSEVQRFSGINEKNRYYTFGWSGIISQKRRYFEARLLYKQLKKLLLAYKKKGIPTKVRLIGYSHGANLLLNLACIRRDEFPTDTFSIDEVYLVGMPIHANTCKQIQEPIFKKIYTLYSHSDRVQTIDVSTATHIFSHRTFKGCVPEKVTQIELRVTGPLKRIPNQCLPSNMRGVVNQSPGHIEFWFFGWTPSNYRKNISLYPLPAAVLLPYLVSTAKTIDSKNVQITIRTEKETACIRSTMDEEYHERPFFSKWQLASLIEKALSYHPSRPEYKECFLELQNSNDIKNYL